MSEAEQNQAAASAAANPYAAPKTNVAPPAAEIGANALIENGRPVSAGRGWTWLAQGFSLFAKSPGVWIGVMLIFFFGMMVVALIPIIGSLAINLLMPVIFAGLLLGCRALQHGEPLEVSHLFAGFQQNVGQLVLVGVIYMCGTMVIFGGVFAVLLGMGLFSAMSGAGQQAFDPAVFGLFAVVFLVAFALMLPLVMAFWFAPALVVFHEQDAISAMKQSFFGCLKNILPYLVYGVLAFLLMIVATIPFFLGWLVLWPVFITTMYTSYQDIFAPGPESE
jgi:hypothetical protein